MDAWYEHFLEDSEKECLCDAEGSYTRAEVEKLSGKIYAYLKANGIGKNDFVLIDLPRSSRIFIAMLGVAKAGAAYVVVESDLGKERRDYIYKDTSSKIIINDSFFKKIKAVDYVNGFETVDLHDAAYAIYTSGTTGTPKGVVHEYGGYELLRISIADPSTGVLRENVNTRFLNIAPFNFVASVMIFALTIYSGATTFTPNYDVIKNLRRLVEYMGVYKITQTFLSPSYLKLIGDKLNPEMNLVYTGSEQARNISISHGDLYNLYLMSETGFVLCQYKIEKPEEVSPVGRPNEGIEVSLTEEGEIVCADPYCRGYLNMEDDTIFKDGMYHTGDIAVLREGGEYLLKGRNVEMIKINGNRVEPLEVEIVAGKVLEGIPCAVKGFEKADDAFVCLYYESDKEIDKKEVSQKMKEYLPYYMIPSHFIRMDSLPKTKSGKLNKKGLLEPSKLESLPFVAPRNAIEEKICNAFKQVLNLKEIGVTTDLFDLGLNSLLAIEAVTILDMDEIQSADIYRCRTIEDLARFYDGVRMDYLSGDEKEMEARKHLYPLNANNIVFWYFQMMANTTAQNLSFACRFNKLVSVEKLKDAINAYTDRSSTFKVMLVADAEGQILQKYSPEKYKPVAIEYMTEDEVEELRKTFVKPFKLLEELPYRIRVIKTKKYSYLFMDIHHILTDGAGMVNIVEEMAKAYRGEPLMENNYFAYCYDMQKYAEDGTMGRNREYVRVKFERAVPCGGQITDPGDEIYGVNELRDTGISLKTLNKFLQDYHTTRNTLFMATTALVLSKYNKARNTRISWQYMNRDANHNQAGYRSFALLSAVTLDKRMKFKDMFDSIENEVTDTIAHRCPSFAVGKMDGPVACSIDDLNDIEEADKMLNFVGKRVELERPYDSIKGAPVGYTNINFVNKNGKLAIRLVTDNNIIKESARDFLFTEVITTLKRILEGDESIISEYLTF